MRSAPSVMYPVLRSRTAGVLMASFWCLGLIPVTGWLIQVTAPAWMVLAVLAWTSLCGALCVWHWWQTPPDRLVWDGHSWSTDSIFDARIALAVDLQFLMILRLMPVASPARWVMVDRAALPAAWHRLRCAVTASESGRAA